MTKELQQAYYLMKAFYSNIKFTKSMLIVLETGESNEVMNYLLVKLGDCEIQFMRELDGFGSNWKCKIL